MFDIFKEPKGKLKWCKQGEARQRMRLDGLHGIDGLLGSWVMRLRKFGGGGHLVRSICQR